MMISSYYYCSSLFSIVLFHSLTVYIQPIQSSAQFSSYLHSECSAASASPAKGGGNGVTCIAINDLYLDSSPCLATNSCNVFAIFKVTQVSRTRYVSDDLKLSLYRFGSKPKAKHSMYLNIRYGEMGTKYECVYSNYSVRGRTRMPYRDPIVDDASGTIDDEVLSCHWLLKGSMDDDTIVSDTNYHQPLDDSHSRWPLYGPTERIDLINWYNVSFELGSNGIVSTQPTNNLPIYRLKYLRENCNKPGGSKFCYHWKAFERTWIVVERWPQQNYLHVLLMINLNFTSIQLKFSPDNGFGNDYVINCDNLSCRESIVDDSSSSEPRPLTNRNSLMKSPTIRRDGPLTRIHFTLPLFFTLDNIDFPLGSSFYINFAITRNQRTDNIWTPKIDLNLRKPEQIKTASRVDSKPEPAANKNRLYGSLTDNHPILQPSLTKLIFACYLLCSYLLLIH